METAAQEKDAPVPHETAFVAASTTPRSGYCRQPEFGKDIRQRSGQDRHVPQADECDSNAPSAIKKMEMAEVKPPWSRAQTARMAAGQR
jgi:hypothetical protein